MVVTAAVASSCRVSSTEGILVAGGQRVLIIGVGFTKIFFYQVHVRPLACKGV